MSEQERLDKANDLIRTIAGCGRNFFSYKGRISTLKLDARRRVWIIDKYSEKRIYTHYRYSWRGFTEGGTLQNLVIRLRNFIKKGDRLPTGTFWFNPTIYPNGDIWGYGSDMEIVRKRAVGLEMVADERR